MKKITLLVFALFLSFSAYSQFPNPGVEGFENTTGPEVLPSTVWNLGTGVTGNQWAVFSNGVGTGRWTINSAITTPPTVCSGLNVAYMNRNQTGGAGLTSQNYLATPRVTVPVNGQLRFVNRTFTAGNTGTFYDVKWAPSTANQTDPAAYTITLATYTEDELTLDSYSGVQNAFNICTTKIINFPATIPAGTQGYIAFIRRNTQLSGTIDGDRWLLDNVQLNSRCLDPTTLGAGPIFCNNATLTWGNPSSAASWEIEVLPAATAVTGFGVLYSGTLPYVATTTSYGSPLVQTPLAGNTPYKYYVRAVCPGSIPSAWVGPFNFTTTTCPPVCGGNYVDAGGPTGNYLPNSTAANGTTVICPTNPTDQVTVTFTAFNTQLNTDILSIYDGNSSAAPLLGSFSGTTLPPTFTSSAANGCLTFVFISNATTNNAGWIANVTCAPPPVCPRPTALTATAPSPTSINLGWTNVGPGTSWQYLVLPVTAPAPTAGTLGTPISTNPFLIDTGLASGTCYNIYVRADCTSTSNGLSLWSNPLNFCTPVAPPVCGGNYVDAGGSTANYPNNSTALNGTTVICPTNPTDQVTVTFTSFNTQLNTDILSIYDGNSSGAPLLGSFSGTTLPPTFTSSAANGCLTFVFISNATTNNTGWIANVTCTPSPACPRPTALTAVGPITPTSINLGWTNVGPGTSWQYIVLPTTSPAPLPGTLGTPITTNPFLINTGLASGTCYNVYVRADCTSTSNGLSLWSNPLNFCTPVAPPVCGGNYVDSGGTAGNYANNENQTTTICPTITGEQVTVTFTAFALENNFDFLRVYDGPNATAPLLGNFTGAVNPGSFTASSASGCLTFVFTSDGSVPAAGWLANITCSPPPPCPKATGLVASAVTSNSATITWTNVGPATAWQVLALPCTAPPPTAASTGWLPAMSPFVYPGLSSATCYNFYVRSDCSSTSNGLSLWAGPVSATTQVAPPLCGGNFVDVGGVAGNYPANSNSTVTICPTNPGEIVTVTFTFFNTEATWDGLYVYDGNAATPGALLPSANGAGNVPGGLAGSYWGNLTGANLPGPFTSTAANGCLTFVFISDGSVQNPGWLANITCSPAPTCAKPTALTATLITQTSATLTWTQPLNPNGSQANAWEILILPAGSPVPTTPGIPATSPYLATGLTPGTAYVFYVRAICSQTDASAWAALPFATIPLNDECANATFAVVNQNLNCVQTTPGTLAGATGSLPASTCPGVANDDVWFTFTATAATHVISFTNVSLPAPAFNYAIFQGTCSGLTQVGTCNSGAGLTAGTTYFLRVYSATAVPQFTTFNLCIGTLPCTEAPAFCTGQTVTYANATNVPSLGQIGCLFTSPNPAFFFLQVNQAGPLSYLISQVDTGGTPRDVDYVAWGPFTSLNAACSGVPANPLPGLIPALTPAQGCSGTLHACSYSAAPTEIMCIPNAQLCQVYVIMITNFSNQAGTVTFTQTNTGGGTTECFPINTFNYPQTYYCQSSPNPTPVLAPGAAAGTYTSTPGLVINPATGTINLAASTPGAYIITSTTQTSTGGVCTNIPSITTTRTVIITAPANATISYPASPYCRAITSSQNVTITGTPGGTYSASPAGLLINANTGAILPVASTPGIYTVTYTIAAIGGCPAFTTTAQVEILPSIIPTFTQVQPICPGDALAPLPTSSTNSPPITGTWSPAINNMATTTYTFTPDAGVCASTAIMTIAVGSTTPTFTQVAPICPGAVLAPLPTTSTNNVTGTWSPALDNTATTTYTFTPTPGVCASTATMTIVVNQAPVVTVNSSTICPGSVATVTATPAVAGNYNYVWTVPAGVPDPGNVASFTTTVAGNYSVVISLVNTNTLCNLSFEQPTATGAFPNLFNQNLVPCWDTTAADGIIEIWPTGFEAPPYAGSQLIEMNGNSVATIYQDFTVNPGTTLDITFAHRGRQGTDAVRVEIGPVAGPFVNLGLFTDGNTAWVLHNVIHAIPASDSPNYRLRFVSVSATGGSPSVGNLLDAISVNVLTGCPSLQATGTVTLLPFTTATFNPIANICQGLPAPLLPTLSTNTPPISGAWNPSVIDTSVVGTTVYTFTPDAGQCATGTTLSVTIDPPSIVPAFNAIPPICQNATPPALPATSSNGGLTGTWSPATIDTSVVGTSTYTFTPDAGQCAVNATMNITIIAPTLATFTQIAAICQGGTAPALPTSSSNIPAITGTWSPATINTANPGNTVYTFTPNAGQCATGTTMTITIHPTPIVLTMSNVDACDSYTLSPLAVGNYYAGPNGVSPITNLTLTSSQLVYVYAQSGTTPNCTDQESFQVTITTSPQFTIEGGCVGAVYVLEVTNANFNTATASYSWSGPNGVIPNSNSPVLNVTTAGTYTCTVSIPNGQSAGSCSTPNTFNATETSCLVPKGVSPNGDGLNDTFDLKGYNVAKLSIFNRYGKTVYSKLDYSEEWFGQSDSGNELPDGTYYYVIERKDGGDTITGWVFINRENK